MQANHGGGETLVVTSEPAGQAMTLEEAIFEELGEDAGAADSAEEVTRLEPRPP
jgi:hypothetical protein